MLDVLSRHWWTLALRGVFAIVFGIMAFVWPGLTIATLIILFGAYAIADGVFALIAAVRGGSGDYPRWAVALEGAVSVVAGIIAIVLPGLTALTLLYIIGFWAIVTGVMEIVAAIRLRKEIEGEWMLAGLGALSILYGAIITVFPGAGAIALAWMIGAYSIIFGGLLVALGFLLKGKGRQVSMNAGGQTV